MFDKQSILREIPRVDEMLQRKDLFFLMEETSVSEVRETVREMIAKVRQEILDGIRTSAPSADEVAEMVQSKDRASVFTLFPLINATGVINHTNLGRALISERAQRHMQEVMGHYSTLEYNLQEGKRGHRSAHVETLLTKVTGAESGMVVNNNAAAVFLMLSEMAAGKEVIISRGELVEIGGSFRIPDIMESSGGILREVGTTNRTWLRDYEKAIGDNTAAILKVHSSNYRIEGFTHEADMHELAALAKEHHLPLLFDLGSGTIVALDRYGIQEPTVRDAIAAGVDVVSFSGDKLLGGLQGGFLCGKKEYIDRIKKHPLARALRVDKMTLAGLEATLAAYLDPKEVWREIPLLRMVSRPAAALHQEADALQHTLAPLFAPLGIQVETVETTDTVGGGAAPQTKLRGYGVAFSGGSPEALEQKFRLGGHIIGMIREGSYILSMRCLVDGDVERIVQEARKICGM